MKPADGPWRYVGANARFDLQINNIPILPLRDMVVYPHGVHPLFVGTESSIRALDTAMADEKQILLVAKRDPEVNEPQQDDLYFRVALSNQ